MATSSRLEKKGWDTTSHAECRRKRGEGIQYCSIIIRNTKKEENKRQKIYRQDRIVFFIYQMKKRNIKRIIVNKK
jgi:hypothetical protein